MKNNKLLLILCSVTALLLLVLVVQFFVGRKDACLTSADYEDLTNQTLVADPKTNFYTDVLEFSDSDTSASNEQTVVTKLSSFYKTHHGKSIYINISGINQDTTSTQTGTARIHNLADQLVKGGVDTSNIRTSDPEFLSLDSNNDGTVTVTVVTGGGCRQ